MLKNAPEPWRGFPAPPATPTLDKMMSERRHLVSTEVEKLLAAVKGTRHAVRDRCLLLMMFRHGLRNANYHDVLPVDGVLIARSPVSVHCLVERADAGKPVVQGTGAAFSIAKRVGDALRRIVDERSF